MSETFLNLSEMAQCITMYIGSSILFLVWHFILFNIYMKTDKFNRNMLFVYFITFWFFHIGNIIYTGILGWNMEPSTDLEIFLDNVTKAGFIVSLLMLVHSRLKGRDKNDKKN
jgi:hypothetical protein